MYASPRGVWQRLKPCGGGGNGGRWRPGPYDEMVANASPSATAHRRPHMGCTLTGASSTSSSTLIFCVLVSFDPLSFSYMISLISYFCASSLLR